MPFKMFKSRFKEILQVLVTEVCVQNAPELSF